MTRHEELVRLLAEQFVRADVSLRELQARADRAGGTRLPRATCADMLAGRRFPKKAVMVAFLRGCRVPEQRLPAWERAWERVRVGRLAAMAARAQAEAQAQLSALATTTPPQPSAARTPVHFGTNAATPDPSPADAGTASSGPGMNIAALPPQPDTPAEAAGQAQREANGQGWPKTAGQAQQDAAEQGQPKAAAQAQREADGQGLREASEQTWQETSGQGQPRAGGQTQQGVDGRGRRWSFVVAVIASLTAAALGLLVGLWVPHPATSGPPGRFVVDDGRAFGPGGASRFTVTVDPANTGVRLTRRLDAGIGRQRAGITVNGTPAGTWQPLPVQRAHRWQDQSVDLPPSVSAGRRSLTVVNTFVSSDQDFNEFLYVVEQQVDGAWETADTLDVGPEHLDAEAAHGYEIIGPQTFAGTQEFTYPPPDGRP
ncbi:hypothetical protein [Nonomuraea rubra]|uniref:Uncharacterized protein n=1 Tax=Nonomuraea rubra TaxID=46180 RepID=A0A7X0NUJ2_9ACTN|nr:hypothetical protein [Nonomuraea rubra]MBB6549894.1 hypothetical protein [Nonomuraea rubra]